jgi:hypothetical protein
MPGGAGIAAKYPGDVGIENDPNVVFADDFETYAQVSDLIPNWDGIDYADTRVRIVTDSANVFHGSQALELELPQSDTEVTAGIKKLLSEQRDVLFLRYYLKYGTNFVRTNHNGSTISAHFFIDGDQATPGIPADGTNKFLAALETERGDSDPFPSPGRLNIYIYHPEQRSQWGDHFFPTGEVMPYSPEAFDFGPDFVSRPDVVPDLDRWYCYEYMVKANTPGQRDGRVTVWLDGDVVADFGNLRLRDIDTLKIDLFILGMSSITSAGEQTKWQDSLVAATSYIGPMVQR